ncbi:MAG TPA: DUF1993 domain-containing protein [Parvularculaceae bacterium]|nr:DUF1993 domain-containing protein [Parvularculaceae bacterium]
MTLSHSAIANTVMAQMFTALQTVLEKGAAYAKSKNIEEQTLLNWRLAPDMFPMSRQVQIACDISARGMARLAGAEMPSFPDTEKSFEELRQRIAKAQAFIKDLDKAKIDANPEGTVTFPVGPETMTMKRSAYLLTFILPNLYFHVTACYANLRACGVPLGKSDFLARPR